MIYTEYDDLEEYRDSKDYSSLKINDWLDISGIDYYEFWSSYNKYKYDNELVAIQRAEWRSFANERRNNRVLYVPDDGGYTDKGNNKICGFSDYEKSFVHIGQSPEDIYVAKEKRKLTIEILRRVIKKFTAKQRVVLFALLYRVREHCKRTCKFYPLGEHSRLCPKFMTQECYSTRYKRYQYERWVNSREVAKILGKNESAISKILDRIQARAAKFKIHRDDYIFLFELEMESITDN